MLKKYMLLAVATVFLAFQLLVSPANAADVAPAIRTVPVNSNGGTETLSLDELRHGADKFRFSCATCHAGGDTKTNPTINLSPGALEGATPNRNNIDGLVDYIKNPTTYDGFTEISEVHPSTKSADVFTYMRNLSEEDLHDIAGHILVQPKILGEQWGGGKASR